MSKPRKLLPATPSEAAIHRALSQDSFPLVSSWRHTRRRCLACWLTGPASGFWRDCRLPTAVDARPLSARPECVEAAMLGYVEYPRESHENRIKHALRAAERAGEKPDRG